MKKMKDGKGKQMISEKNKMKDECKGAKERK